MWFWSPFQPEKDDNNIEKYLNVQMDVYIHLSNSAFSSIMQIHDAESDLSVR